VSYQDDFQYSKPKPKPKPRVLRVYVSTFTGKYRFRDGTIISMTVGVSPQVTEAQLSELKKYNRVKEVK
jgi:hypothetical protein